MKTLLVTGSKGQLGMELSQLSIQYPQFQFTFVERKELNLASTESLQNYFATNRFDFVINCAAYTAVEKAEEEYEIAQLVNAEALKVLAEFSARNKMRLIHISTDYVFDGNFIRPISEIAQPNPLSVYGRTKLEGENHVLRILPNAYIIRTSWVYSTFGKNFVKTIIDLSRKKSEIGVVVDQIGTPTYAVDLAKAIMRIVESISTETTDEPGIYHFTNEGVTSWYDFAHSIVAHFDYPCKVRAIKTEEYRTLAQRPKFSVLDKSKFKNTFNFEIQHWSVSLKVCLDKMFETLN